MGTTSAREVKSQILVFSGCSSLFEYTNSPVSKARVCVRWALANIGIRIFGNSYDSKKALRVSGFVKILTEKVELILLALTPQIHSLQGPSIHKLTLDKYEYERG